MTICPPISSLSKMGFKAVKGGGRWLVRRQMRRLPRFDEVTARVELVLHIINQPDDAVKVRAGVVFFGQVQLGTVIDGSTLRIGNDFDGRTFALGLIGGRLEHD